MGQCHQLRRRERRPRRSYRRRRQFGICCGHDAGASHRSERRGRRSLRLNCKESARRAGSLHTVTNVNSLPDGCSRRERALTVPVDFGPRWAKIHTLYGFAGGSRRLGGCTADRSMPGPYGRGAGASHHTAGRVLPFMASPEGGRMRTPAVFLQNLRNLLLQSPGNGGKVDPSFPERRFPP